jgi:hypothetical protein
MPDNSKMTLKALKRTIAMKTADTLNRKEVEKLVGMHGGDSIYQDWWDDKPHQILARVLKGKLHD